MQQSAEEDIMNEVHLAAHSVMIRGINPEIPPAHAEKMILQVLRELYDNRNEER